MTYPDQDSWCYSLIWFMSSHCSAVTSLFLWLADLFPNLTDKPAAAVNLLLYSSPPQLSTLFLSYPASFVCRTSTNRNITELSSVTALWSVWFPGFSRCLRAEILIISKANKEEPMDFCESVEVKWRFLSSLLFITWAEKLFGLQNPRGRFLNDWCDTIVGGSGVRVG